MNDPFHIPNQYIIYISFVFASKIDWDFNSINIITLPLVLQGCMLSHTIWYFALEIVSLSLKAKREGNNPM